MTYDDLRLLHELLWEYGLAYQRPGDTGIELARKTVAGRITRVKRAARNG